MKTTNLNNPQSLREHVLVPLLLVMANITLGIAAYLLHQLYVLMYADNHVLLKPHDLSDARVWQSTADYYLFWSIVFVLLFMGQLISLKLRHEMIFRLIFLASLGAVYFWI